MRYELTHSRWNRHLPWRVIDTQGGRYAIAAFKEKADAEEWIEDISVEEGPEATIRNLKEARHG